MREVRPNITEDADARDDTECQIANSDHLIELTEDGRDYRLLPSVPDREGFAAGWPILEAELRDSDSRCTRMSLLKNWPDDHEKPSKNTLIR